MLSSRLLVRAVAASLLTLPAFALAQIRVGEWNVSYYDANSTARTTAFQTALYGSYQGRSFAPDVMVGQEFINAAGVQAFVNLLNGAQNSPGDWASAPFVDNTGGNGGGVAGSNAFFYRTSKFDFLGSQQLSVRTGVSTDPPRNPMRFDVRLKGYQNAANAPLMSLYSDHFKSGSGSADQANRVKSANAIVTDAATLPAGRAVLFGADMNIQSSNQAAYQNLTTNGPFLDPIRTPGSWNGNAAFRYVHTQDPAAGGEMDDRHDQLLINSTLADGKGIEYIGDTTKAYSTTTWNDPNHSYRAWGNDGSSFNASLNTTTNGMVGPEIARALQATALSGGHLPVFLDLKTAGEIGASTTILDFGDVELGSTQARSLSLFNSVDAALYGVDGVQSLFYSLGATSGFSAPIGVFSDFAGGGMNAHNIGLDTTVAGLRTGTLTITDVSGATRTISLRANVGAVPEPATLAALGLGMAAFLRRRKRA